MNKPASFLAAALTLFPVVVVSAGMLKGAVSSPSPGVICDKKSAFCAASQGISVGFTKEYLGETSEAKMMKQINEVGAANFDASWFTLSNGVCCKTKEKACYFSKVSDKVDAAYTKALFGGTR